LRAVKIERVIYIRPVGTVEEDVIKLLQKVVSRYFDLTVEIMNNMAIPEGSFERSRNQHNSTKILKEILSEIPPDTFKILGVVDRDICIPILTYVFGEAQLGGKAALVSLTRLRQEFYDLEPDEHIFFERLHKETFHELGHTFGLTHCPQLVCVMRLSNTVIDVDRKGRTFCRACSDVLLSTIEEGGLQDG
jgi:archaemetzincin